MFIIVSLEVRIIEDSDDKDVLGLEHDGHVRGTPILLYLEEKFFLMDGISLEWNLNSIRACSRSSSPRYAFLSYFSADTSS